MPSFSNAYDQLPENFSCECPFCKSPNALEWFPIIRNLTAYAHEQKFHPLYKTSILNDQPVNKILKFVSPNEYFCGVCHGCGRVVFYENCRMVYPCKQGIEPAKDMPEDVLQIFEEAQSVMHLSPRSACALLRICLERIADHVAQQNGIHFEKRERLYDKIKKLNLPFAIQQICDACRLAGNENAHTGELDLSGEDTAEIALTCSELINVLVSMLISPNIQAARVLEKLGKS
jgi:hypothetical protein